VAFAQQPQVTSYYLATQSKENSLAILMDGMVIPTYIMDKDLKEIWSLIEIIKL
jgi:hypothetical protein